MPVHLPDATMQWIQEEALAFMASPANDMGLDSPEPLLGSPLFGVAAGDDPIWESYKRHVGPFHWTPSEAFALAGDGDLPPPQELFVLSWVLPQTDQTRRDHRTRTELPSERWARSRTLGEDQVNDGLRRHLVEALGTRGIRAVAPQLLPQWSRMESPDFVFASTWSERHAAHAAGLGTFGLCDGLITPVGKSMRTGAIVLDAPLPVTPRPYGSHREYCLFFNAGICGKCIKRCPAGALSRQGHDKRLCKAFIRDTAGPVVTAQWGMSPHACGLCQVAVPCESGIPPRPRRVARETRTEQV